MHSKILFVTIGFLISLSCITAQHQKYLVLYSDAVYFNSGSDKINPKFNKALVEVADAINNHKDAKAWIQAHTDSLGSYHANQVLSDQRANSVYQFLSKLGVDSAQLKIDSHGEYIPLKSNGTAQGRALNRRVTIEVVRPYIPRPKIEHQCTIQGKVVDAETKQVVATQLIFQSLAGKDSVETDADGNYKYVVNMEMNVNVRAYAKGYFFVSKICKTLHNQVTEVNFLLEPAIIGGKITLSDLYFQGGTPLLMNASEKALDGVVAFMKFNKKLKIEIGGHINKPNRAPVAKNSPSFKLSESRAAVVYHYLIKHGIDKSRLTYKGYGNSEMLYPRASTPVQEQINRRVELKVVE